MGYVVCISGAGKTYNSKRGDVPVKAHRDDCWNYEKYKHEKYKRFGSSTTEWSKEYPRSETLMPLRPEPESSGHGRSAAPADQSSTSSRSPPFKYANSSASGS